MGLSPVGLPLVDMLGPNSALANNTVFSVQCVVKPLAIAEDNELGVSQIILQLSQGLISLGAFSGGRLITGEVVDLEGHAVNLV